MYVVAVSLTCGLINETGIGVISSVPEKEKGDLGSVAGLVL